MADEKYTTITPVLSTTAGYLQDVRDQIAALLRFVVMNPGWTSSYWEDDLVSFRKLSSAYEADRAELAGRLQSAVESVLKRMFADQNFELNFSTGDLSETQETALYRISFDILMLTGSGEELLREPALVSGTITADPNTNDISIVFNESVNANSVTT